MTLSIFIAGLVLLLAGPWFDHQETVGWILTLGGGIPILLSILIVIASLWAAVTDR